MVLRILGIALAIWIGLSLLGALLHVLGLMLVIGAVVFIGAGIVSAVRGRNRRELR